MKIDIISDFKPVPWKNGLGLTQEILIEPATADFTSDPFDYRISSAPIAAGKSTFSFFKGYRRLLVLLNGSVTLTTDSSVTELPAYTPHFFSGDDHTTAEVTALEGAIDFGIIYSPEVSIGCEMIVHPVELKLEKDKKYFLYSHESPIIVETTEYKEKQLLTLTSDRTELVKVEAKSPIIKVSLAF